MGEETMDRREFVSRIGAFFLIIGLFALMIFISTDISRSDRNLTANSTNTAYAALARQTQQVGAQTALSANLPTPTRIKVADLRATQDYIVYGVQALQTRDAAARGISPHFPTPTLIPPEEIKRRSESISYVSLLCVGALGVGAGLVILRMTAPPAKSAGRFAGIRQFRQKQREAREKRAAAQKEKQAKKKK